MAVWPETDWPKIIETHRQALEGVLAGLVALANCLGGGPTVPRHLQRAVFRLLRPAESAARRLVILVARRLPMAPLPALRPLPPRPAPLPAFLGPVVRINLGLAIAPPLPKRRRRAAATDARPPIFQILDPIRRVRLRRYPARTSVPRILFPGYAEPFRIVRPRHDDAMDAKNLTRRLAALAGALDDLPREARRYALWELRNARAHAAGRSRRASPLRWGRPPGQSARRTHEVHDILEKLHDYADYALAYPDTS